jgi:hypothetical protein
VAPETEAMSDILDLPPETLAEVVSYLNTHECTALWLCGDLRLQYKLGKGKAVRKMVVKWKSSSSCPWPSQITHFDGLQSFSLEYDVYTEENRSLNLHLSNLAPKLKKLELIFKSSIALLEQLCLVQDFQNLETLYLSKSPNEGRINFEIPRNVTDLKISPTGLQPNGLCLPLSLLPPRLTRLTFLRGTLDFGFSNKFPETLEYLEITFGDIEKQWATMIRLLPPGLQHLSFRSCFGIILNSDTEDWTALRTLTGLKYLKIPVWDLTPVILKNIPRQIEKLGEFSVSSEIVHLLPDSLTELEIQDGKYSTIPFLPSNLRSLTLNGPLDQLVNKLPKNLEGLVLQKAPTPLNSECIFGLPRNLTHLDIYSTNNALIFDDDIELIFKALPPKLTSLNAYPNSSDLDNDLDSEDYPTFPTPSESSLYLPRCMKILQIGLLEFSRGHMAQWIIGLPTCLTSLKILVKQLEIGIFTSIGSLKRLDWLKIGIWHTPGSWAQYLDFKALPRSLRCLELESGERTMNSDCTDDTESDISDGTFVGAPLSLNFVLLPASPLITKKCLDHLPNVHTLVLNDTKPDWFTHPTKRRPE